MGSIYLDWLDDAVSAAAKATGYQWKVLDSSWLHRARSSGGYDQLPLCVMWHHTAGSDNAQADAEYQAYSADSRPISNITVDSKIAIILAGGATNTNGSGRSMSFSRGTVATDDMNKRAVGIEICNNGVGAPYPERQLNFLFALSNEINRRCGNQPTDVGTHQFYAPDRKVDPARADAVQGPWRPGSCTSSGSWDLDDLRAECKRRWSGGTTPPPTPEEDDDVQWRVAKHSDTGAYYIGDGKTSYWVSDSGGDVTMIESLIRMAPGAINIKPFVGADSSQKPLVTSWDQVGKINGANMKRYVGANPRLP